MTKKFTQDDFLQRLKIRNNKNINKKVFLYPNSQKYNGQNSKLQFSCEHKHTWVARPGNVLSGQGCPQCKLLNDSLNKRKPLDKVIKEFKNMHGETYDYTLVKYVNNNTKIKIICKKHGIFEQTPSCHFYSKQGCPECAKENQRKTIEQFIKDANNTHKGVYDYSKVEYKNGYTPISIICPHHGAFKQRPDDHINGSGCKECANTTISYKQISWLMYISNKENINIQHALNGGECLLPSTKFRVDGYCKETNTVYEFHGDAFHGNLKRYNPDTYCHPFDDKITALELYNKTKKKEEIIKKLGYNMVSIWESEFDNLDIPIHKFEYDSIIHVNHSIPEKVLSILKLRLMDNEFKGYKHKHNYKCLLCGEIFKTTLSQRKQTYKIRKVKGCPTCARNKNIDFATKVKERLNVEGIYSNITQNDIVNIDNKVGIFISDFVNGVEQQNGKYFNRDLFNKYENRLLIFFQDEWIHKNDLIIKKIIHILKKSSAKRIYARQCIILPISSNKKKDFLNRFHIQENDSSQIYLGAYYNDKLIAVMTFSTPRIALGGNTKHKKVFELVRFATHDEYHVIGIASKLLKYFEQNIDYDTIYSFADKRWSIGNLYEKIGFTLEHHNSPDYFYVINNERKHRWSYRKDRLKDILPSYNNNLTEYENMLNAGYDRIWGVGTIKYVKNKY